MKTAKWLNSIITKYMDRKYIMVRPTYEFIQIARLINKSKVLVSLDVENLFINIPVEETIEIIFDKVYFAFHVPRD